MKSAVISILVTGSTLLLVAACAVKPAAPVVVYNTDTGETNQLTSQQAADADAKVCTKEYVTGTRFPVTYCASKNDRDLQARQAREDHEFRNNRTAIPGRQ